jgi:hypothetical protein
VPVAAQLVHLGDVSLTLPAAAAITSLLLAWRAWRAALWWTLLFALGIGAVAASKVAFIGWGTGIPGLDFKALSGHASGATAVYPMLLYLLLHQAGPVGRCAGTAAGMAIGALVVWLLIVQQHHSPAEAVGGYVLGAAISLVAIRRAGPLPRPRAFAAVVSFSLVFMAGAWLMQWAHLGWWMIKAARLLSGKVHVYELDFQP